jgi:hypothetical protein
MITVKTSELTGAVLDWAVSKCGDCSVYLRRDFIKARHKHLESSANIAFHLEYQSNDPIIGDIESGATTPLPSYSTDWSQGGPIIEREKISLLAFGLVDWKATFDYGGSSTSDQYGPTPLIAALRCYVTSKLGDNVEIPEELL